MQVIGMPFGGGEQPSEAQMAAMEAHAEAVHAMEHRVEAEICDQLLFWAPVLCSCKPGFRRFTLASPPPMSECLVHGQARILFGDRTEHEHE